MNKEQRQADKKQELIKVLIESYHGEGIVRAMAKSGRYNKMSKVADALITAFPALATLPVSEVKSGERNEGLPEHGIEVLGYSEQWVDEDYNPKGVRICFQNDGNWISTYWNNYQDCYETDSKTSPTKWKNI